MLVQSVNVFVIVVVATRKNFVLGLRLVVGAPGRVDKPIVHITVCAPKRHWDRGISRLLLLGLQILLVLPSIGTQLRADGLLRTLVRVLFEWNVSAVESHSWILFLLILNVVLVYVLSTTRIDENQIRLLLQLGLLMLERERQW